MSKFFIIFVLIIFIKIASSHKYLFESASISYKRLKEKPVKNESFKKLISIDHHTFVKATDIKVRTNSLYVLYKDAVKNLPYLKNLRLKECGIRSLQPQCLRNLPKLEKVHLQENDLSIIDEGVFNFLPIKELWLQKNEITTIRPGAFDNMPRLEVIRLNRNLLSEWDSRWFTNTPNLSQLFFRRNLIKKLPARAFVNIKTSHKVNGEELVDTCIYLSDNQISYIHPEALRGIDALDELCLRRNNLKEIDWGIFRHMSELHKLSMRRNNLSEIDADAFDRMSELLELDLSLNKFECVPYKVVKKVKKIDLSKNYKMGCDCLMSLRERLSDDESTNEIVDGHKCEFD